jgi:formate dehydrogenase accessory protein FdhD
VNDQRASVMIHGGRDITHHLAVMTGAVQERWAVPDSWPRHQKWTVPDDVLLDILREAWGIFRKDRMAEGSIHAALASSSGIEVVAFDLTAENAVAKALGWTLQTGTIPTHEILIVNGLVTRRMVDAAVRLGVLIIATPNVATNDAWRAARLAGISIVGYMRHRRAGLFHDAGLVTPSEDHPDT